MSTLPPQTARFTIPGRFALQSGSHLHDVTLAYRTWGTLDDDGGNAVVVTHALTGDAHADRWWPALFGPGRALDPARDFIVCANVLGGCAGSTGPASLAPDGLPYGARFPRVSVRDLVRAQQRLLEHLGVRAIRLVIGGSLGGMQALEWALLDARVESAAVIAAPARHEAWAIAWSDAQRRALATDPEFERGGPAHAGLAAARAIAMVSYRSPASFASRFGRSEGVQSRFAVQDWLGHHGDSLIARFEARSYATLLDAMDAHDVGAERGGVTRALNALRVPVLVVAIESDQLYPPAESEALAASLPQARLVRLASPHGHDAFLIDAPEVERLVREFRASTGSLSPASDGAARAAGGSR